MPIRCSRFVSSLIQQLANVDSIVESTIRVQFSGQSSLPASGRNTGHHHASHTRSSVDPGLAPLEVGYRLMKIGIEGNLSAAAPRGTRSMPADCVRSSANSGPPPSSLSIRDGYCQSSNGPATGRCVAWGTRPCGSHRLPGSRSHWAACCERMLWNCSGAPIRYCQ